MPITQIPLIGVSDSGRSPDINSHRAINLMPQMSAPNGRGGMHWVATPGLTEFVTTETGGWPSVCYGLYTKSEPSTNKIYGVFKQDPNYTLNTIAKNEPLGADLLTLTSFSPTAMTIWAGTLGWIAFVQGSYVYCTPTALAPTEAAAANVTLLSNEVAISSIVQNSGTTYRMTTATPHGLSNADTFIVKGSTNFNNRIYTVTSSPAAGSVIADFTHINNTEADETGLVNAYSYGQTAGNGAVDFDSITSLDTYFIANTARRVYVSYPDDPRIWVLTNYFAASRDPDAIKRVYAYGGQVYVFGETTTESYYNGGQGVQPFVPSRPIAFDWGILGIHTLAELDDGLIWLANRSHGKQSVVMLSGGRITAVSNNAVEYYLNRLDTSHSTAYAFSYRDEYGEFYQISFLVATNTYATWCFDAETSRAGGLLAWHERQDSAGGRHRAKYYTYAPGLGGHIVSDHTLSEIYILTLDAATEFDGDSVASTVDRTGYSGHIASEGKGLLHNSLFIDMENPVGTGTVTISWSDDGGHTYTSGVSSSFTGRGTRLEIFGLGFARYDRVYKIVFNDVTLPINVIDAYLNVEPCRR